MNRRVFLLLAAAIALLAFGLREWYVLAAHAVSPVAGDGIDYMRYAYNLVHEGVFSRAPVGTALTPDAYRGPGYPLFLAALMELFPAYPRWLAAVYQAQAVLGALTVLATIALARRWVGRGPALVSGLLIALWPHHVVATGAVLCEVLFGLLIVVALLCRRPVLSGLAFAAAALTNPLIALFPVGAWIVYRRREWAVVAAVSLGVLALWGLRPVAPSPSRAVINIVQGSHPDYHDNYRWQKILARAYLANRAVNVEIDHAIADPAAGLRGVRERIQSDPLHYADWYFVQKSMQLWDWDIRVGYGGIYTLETQHSPYAKGSLMHATELAYLLANPILSLLLLASLLCWRNPVALAVLYLTAIHVVFQSEPRYAVAYRPLECVMVVMVVVWGWSVIRQRSGRWGERAGVARGALGQPEVVEPAIGVQ